MFQRITFFFLLGIGLDSALTAEKVLSREHSFIAPSLVVRQEVKKESLPPKPSQKIPVPSPRVISLSSLNDMTSNSRFGSHIVIARPVDLVFIKTAQSSLSPNAYYSLDSAPYKKATGAIPLPSSGTHSLTYYSLDFFGNREGTKTKTLIIDAEPPLVSARLLPELKSDDERLFCDLKSNLTIEATDASSGVKSIFWKTNLEENWNRYTGSISIHFEDEEDSYTLEFYSIDFAGNITAVKTMRCYLPSSALPNKNIR
jgi:hypothetical protein